MTTVVTGASGPVGRSLGAERLHLFPYPETASAVATLARRVGVRWVTVLSSGSVTADMTGPAVVSVRLPTVQGGWAIDHADDFR